MDFRELITNRPLTPAVWLLRAGLRLLSLPYSLAARTKNWLYDHGFKQAYVSGLPTICVGNLSVGGTGKSPVVAWLAQRLREQGVRVAILSRGYGQLDDGRNDEALELELTLPDVPHLQHWDRIVSAKLARDELDMQCLLLDDGFQHRRLARDLDIVLIDATDPKHARTVLPRGLYREPMSGLARAQVVLLTRVDQVDETTVRAFEQRIRRAAPDALLLRGRHQPKDLWIQPQRFQPLSSLSDGRPVLAFCGIGNPNAFFRTLEESGARLLDTRVWPDHHSYQADDIQQLSHWVKEHPDAEWLICTVKDAVKIQLAEIAGLRLGALRIELGLSTNDADRLRQQVEDTLQGVPGKGGASEG